MADLRSWGVELNIRVYSLGFMGLETRVEA